MKNRKSLVLSIVLPMALLLLPALVLMRPGASPTLSPLAWAQVSSCGNAILDPGEECDPPGSISCPPGSPAGAILACNSDCTCPSAPAALDHFQCYAIKPRHFGPTTVTVVDRFGTLSERLLRIVSVCQPTRTVKASPIRPTTSSATRRRHRGTRDSRSAPMRPW
jgi:hypothetical protein